MTHTTLKTWNLSESIAIVDIIYELEFDSPLLLFIVEIPTIERSRLVTS